MAKMETIFRKIVEDEKNNSQHDCTILFNKSKEEEVKMVDVEITGMLAENNINTVEYD